MNFSRKHQSFFSHVWRQGFDDVIKKRHPVRLRKSTDSFRCRVTPLESQEPSPPVAVTMKS